MPIDLHSHSTVSDGRLSPAELAEAASRAGLSALGLTDHDTVDGHAVCAAACAEHGITFVPGVELSCDPGRRGATLHILGYFVRPDAPELVQLMRRLIAARDQRNPRIIERLRALGVDITLDEVSATAGEGVVGRPHIADVLIRKGYAKTIQDAFNRYLAEGGAAYVPKERADAAAAIAAIRSAGGVASLAHAAQLRCADFDALRHTIAALVDNGLEAVEIWHPDHDVIWRRRLEEMVERLGILATGGSDFHGEHHGSALGSQGVPDQCLDDMRDLRARRV